MPSEHRFSVEANTTFLRCLWFENITLHSDHRHLKPFKVNGKRKSLKIQKLDIEHFNCYKEKNSKFNRFSLSFQFHSNFKRKKIQDISYHASFRARKVI